MTPATRAPWKFLEELIGWATPEVHKPDLLEAKKAFFERTGEIFEDDRQLELRMASFLEHYVCDRPAAHLAGRTPARARYEEALRNETPERAAAFRPFTETVHGLFEVRRMSPSEVRLRGLFSGIDYDVAERRQLVGLEVGDVLECRLIPFAGLLHFSSAWCFHPHEAAGLIRAEARRRLETSDKASEQELIDDCAQRSLKVERYRQIAVEKIYDFTGRAI
ncbi:MAG: hypothetical protein AB1938_16145 [Myxococcota bacterium]